MRRIRKYRKCLKRKRVERRQDETSKRTSHVVDENRHSFRNVSNENHRVDLVCAFSLFVNQREIDVQTIGDRRHADRKTNGRDFLRRNDFLSIYRFAPKNKEKKRRVFLLPLRNDLNLRRQDWRQQRSWNREYAKKSNGWRPVRQTNYRREYRKIPGKKIRIDFSSRETFRSNLNLRRVQVHSDDVIGAGDAQHVSDQFGRNRSATLKARKEKTNRFCFLQCETNFVFSILSSVRETRNDGGHSRRRSDLTGVDHDEKLH